MITLLAGQAGPQAKHALSFIHEAFIKVFMLPQGLCACLNQYRHTLTQSMAYIA